MTALRSWTGAGEETSLAVGVNEEVDVECFRETISFPEEGGEHKECQQTL